MPTDHIESPEAFAALLADEHMVCACKRDAVMDRVSAAEAIRARDAAVRREAALEQERCWHCHVCLAPPSRPHCEMCPADGDCGEADCGEPGCEDDVRALAGGSDD